MCDGPVPEAPVPEAAPAPVEVRPKVYLPPLEVGSTGEIVTPLAVLKHEAWELSPRLGSPNHDWRVGDDEYVHPWAEKGDRLTVLADAGDDSDPERLVQARMETGKYPGRTYKIERKSIAAAK